MSTERNRLVFEAAVEFVVASLSPGEPVPNLGDAVAVAESLAQRVFGPEGATSKTEVAPSASEPIRRGDLVTRPPSTTRLRVIATTGDMVRVVQDVDGGGEGGWCLLHELRKVQAAPLVCPGHKVDLATRKCVHCGLADKAIVAAGQTWSAADGTAEPVHMSLNAAAVRSGVSLKVEKVLPSWANDVYQAILRARADGRMSGVRVLVDNHNGDPPYQLVVSVRDFLTAFGLEGESRD